MVDPVYGVSLERTVPAVDLALEYINLHPDLFPAINLTYGSMVNSISLHTLMQWSRFIYQNLSYSICSNGILYLALHVFFMTFSLKFLPES